MDKARVKHPAQITAVKANIRQFAVGQGIQFADDTMPLNAGQQTIDYRTKLGQQRRAFRHQKRRTEAHGLGGDHSKLAVVDGSGHGY